MKLQKFQLNQPFPLQVVIYCMYALIEYRKNRNHLLMLVRSDMIKTVSFSSFKNISGIFRFNIIIFE